MDGALTTRRVVFVASHSRVPAKRSDVSVHDESSTFPPSPVPLLTRTLSEGILGGPSGYEKGGDQ